jgi:hypothetical protein
MTMSSLKNDKNLSAFDGAGAESVAAPTTGLVTLGVDDYYFEIPITAEGWLQSVQILTGALIAGVFTIETSNFPQTGPAGAVTTWDETIGNWVNENPASAYAATVGTGWTVSALTLTKTAGAGAAMIHLGNLGARRCRIKAAITTGGTVRVAPHGKE